MFEDIVFDDDNGFLIVESLDWTEVINCLRNYKKSDRSSEFCLRARLLLDSVGTKAGVKVVLNSDLLGLLSDEDSDFLFDAIGMLSNLKILVIHGLQLHDNNCNAIANIITISKGLREIVLKSCNLSDEDYNQIDENMMRDDKVQSIHRYANVGYSTIFRSLGESQTLKKVTLERCNFADEDCITLADALKLNTDIRRVDIISNFNITDKGYITIVDALEQNCFLREMFCGPMDKGHYNSMDFYLRLNTEFNRYKFLSSTEVTRDQYVDFLIRVHSSCHLSSARRLSLLYYFIKSKPSLIIESNEKKRKSKEVNSIDNGTKKKKQKQGLDSYLYWCQNCAQKGFFYKRNLEKNDENQRPKRKKQKIFHGHSSSIEELLTKNDKITEALFLDDCGIEDSDCTAIANALKSNCNLKEIFLENNRDITSVGWTAIFESLKSNCALEGLHLSSLYLSDKDCSALANALKYNTALKRIILIGAKNVINKDIDIGYKEIAESLKNNATLQELNLYESDLVDKDFVALAGALKRNTGLKRLYLDGNKHVTHLGWEALAQSLRENDILEELNLKGCNLGDEDCLLFADAIKCNRGLKKMSIGDNPKITSVGVQALGNALEENTALEALLFDVTVDPDVREKIDYLLQSNRDLNQSLQSANIEAPNHHQKSNLYLYLGFLWCISICFAILCLEVLGY